jgi:polyisoprenoid-binding protein YceI
MATWKIDAAHTTAGFAVKHMMFTTVRGKFNEVEGSITFDPANPGAASVDASVNAASVFTGVGDRDNHLKGADFFDAPNHEKITFKSTGVKNATPEKATVVGNLTIRGVTKEVALTVEYLGTGKNPWGATVAGFNAAATINREDFGLTWNQALEAGGILVGRDVKLELDVQAVLVTETETAAS